MGQNQPDTGLDRTGPDIRSAPSVDDVKHIAWGVKTRGAEISVDDVKHKAWEVKTWIKLLQ